MMLSLRSRLVFGVLAPIILAAGIFALGLTVPGYSQVRQTVSEIGEVDSPARIPFAIMLCAVGICLLVFSSAVNEVCEQAGDSKLTGTLIAIMGFCAAGVGIFAYPNPLHNVFGMAELIGYQAPIALALTWRSNTHTRVVRFSWFMYVLVILALVANLSVLDRHSRVWLFEKPVYGTVQRALFAVWFFWSGGLALFLLPQGVRTSARALEKGQSI